MSNLSRSAFAAFLLALLTTVFAGCRSTPPDDGLPTTVYTRTNLRGAPAHDGSWEIVSTNILSHPKLLRAGTRVEIEAVGNGKLRLRDEHGSRYRLVYQHRHHMMSFREWFDRQFSTRPIELPADLDEAERRAIHHGQPAQGMSREAFFLAMGFPPTNLSPQLDAPELVYQSGRIARRYFQFDEDDRLVGVGTASANAPE